MRSSRPPKPGVVRFAGVGHPEPPANLVREVVKRMLVVHRRTKPARKRVDAMGAGGPICPDCASFVVSIMVRRASARTVASAIRFLAAQAEGVPDPPFQRARTEQAGARVGMTAE